MGHIQALFVRLARKDLVRDAGLVTGRSGASWTETVDCCRTRTLQLTRLSVAALPRDLAAERQSLYRLRMHPPYSRCGAGHDTAGLLVRCPGLGSPSCGTTLLRVLWPTDPAWYRLARTFRFSRCSRVSRAAAPRNAVRTLLAVSYCGRNSVCPNQPPSFQSAFLRT